MPPSDDFDVRHVSAEVHGRYLLRSPKKRAEGLLVGFHGFGETAEIHLEELGRLPELENWVRVSVQALHPFYTRLGQIVACWMTSQDRELAIADNVAYVTSVLQQVRREVPDVPLAILGFSQGTAMAYRAAAYSGLPVMGVVALGGDVPPELSELDALPFEKALVGRGFDEDWYSTEKLAEDVELLRNGGVEPQVVEFEGGHEFTDAFRQETSRFLRSLA